MVTRHVRPPVFRRSKHSRRLPKVPEIRQVGPGEPPAGFVGPWNSRSEWILYWALSKIFKDPEDPRQPPFTGGFQWEYQRSEFGGRSRLGGQVVDFVVHMANGNDVAIDLQTQRYHLYISPERTAYDYQRMLSLARFYEIIPIQEVDLILDPTGEQAVSTVVRALGGRARIGPKSGGTAFKARRGRLYGTRGVQT